MIEVVKSPDGASCLSCSETKNTFTVRITRQRLQGRQGLEFTLCPDCLRDLSELTGMCSRNPDVRMVCVDEIG